MTWLTFALFVGSVVAVVLVMARRGWRGAPWREVALDVVLVGLFAVPTVFALQLPLAGPKARGTVDQTPFLVVLYVCLLLGMLAQYAHSRLSRPKAKRPPFDFGLFIAPVFSSPIIFIPLLAAVQSAGVDLYRADAARFMLYLVAFENGYFWKLIFDQRRENAGSNVKA